MQALFKTTIFRVNISTIKFYEDGSIWSTDDIIKYYKQQLQEKLINKCKIKIKNKNNKNDIFNFDISKYKIECIKFGGICDEINEIHNHVFEITYSGSFVDNELIGFTNEKYNKKTWIEYGIRSCLQSKNYCKQILENIVLEKIIKKDIEIIKKNVQIMKLKNQLSKYQMEFKTY